MSGTPGLSTLIDIALAEDVGPGDWTTLWTVPAGRDVEAQIIAKADGVIAGVEAARETFERLDQGLTQDYHVADGDAVAPKQTIVTFRGSAQTILTGERVALNFLQQLSGIATLTREYVRAVEGTGARILDTRKTTPGQRQLEKEAVRSGGGLNHRFGLHDMVLIKENHIRAAGGIEAAVSAVRARNELELAIEVETTNLEEVRQAVELGVDRILLDNMSSEMLRDAVRLIRTAEKKIEIEASGGVSLKTVRGIAETGVDFISVGALTHSAPALDLSLLVQLDS